MEQRGGTGKVGETAVFWWAAYVSRIVKRGEWRTAFNGFSYFAPFHSTLHALPHAYTREQERDTHLGRCCVANERQGRAEDAVATGVVEDINKPEVLQKSCG